MLPSFAALRECACAARSGRAGALAPRPRCRQRAHHAWRCSMYACMYARTSPSSTAMHHASACPCARRRRRYGNTSCSTTWYVLGYLETCGDVRAGQVIMQIGMGGGMKVRRGRGGVMRGGAWVARGRGELRVGGHGRATGRALRPGCVTGPPPLQLRRARGSPRGQSVRTCKHAWRLRTQCAQPACTFCRAPRSESISGARCAGTARRTPVSVAATAAAAADCPRPGKAAVAVPGCLHAVRAGRLTGRILPFLPRSVAPPAELPADRGGPAACD